MAHPRALVGLARALLIPIRTALAVFCTVWGESLSRVPRGELQSCLSIRSVVGGLVPLVWSSERRHGLCWEKGLSAECGPEEKVHSEPRCSWDRSLPVLARLTSGS